MNTEQLVTMLARQAGPIHTAAGPRRFATALAWGLPGSALIMATVLGVRADLGAAVLLPMFWMKMGFPLAVAALMLGAATRLARPGGKAKLAPVLLAGLVLMLWTLAAVVLVQTAPEQRTALLFGSTWLVCLFNIPMLSLPLFAALLWALKGLAPTRPALAGAAAGLLASGLAAALYTLHCPEMDAPFLALWYVAGMAIPALGGAATGSRLLRW
jgi:hypothetical protein